MRKLVRNVLATKRVKMSQAAGAVVQMSKSPSQSDWSEKIGRLQDIYVASKTVHGRLIELPTNRTYWIKVNLNEEPEPLVTFITKDKEKELYAAMNFSDMLYNHSTGYYTIGADPEIFVVDQHDTIIPAWLFLKSKGVENPFWDGFQAEFTLRPRNCLAFLVDETRDRLKDVLYKAQNVCEKAKLTYKSVLDIPDSVLRAAEYKYAQLGCAPSKNAYGVAPLVVKDPYTLPIRFAGCHLHLSLTIQDEQKATSIVRGIDSLLGVLSVALFQNMEDHRRRMYYGKAGEYRQPKYGIEYRTISSAMLSHPALFHLCYDIGRFAAALTESGTLATIWDTKKFDIPEIINFYDVKSAQKLLKLNEKALKAMLSRLYAHQNGKYLTALYNMILEGAIHYLPVHNMQSNWRLNKSQRWPTHSEGSNCCVYKLNFANPTKIEDADDEYYDDDDDEE